MRRLIDGNRQPRPHGGRDREHEVMSVPPDDRLSQAGEQIVDRAIE